MIVVVAGMYRSGSTFSFNVVRELLEHSGSVRTQASDSIDRGLTDTQVSHAIVKSHAPDQSATALIRLGLVRCVCTYRKPEDAVASLMRAFAFGLDDSIRRIRLWLEWHRSVASYCLNVEYQQIDTSPLLAILRIQRWLTGRMRPMAAAALRWRYDKRRLKDTYDQLVTGEDVRDIGFSYYDPRTYFHRRHISSVRSETAVELLTEQELRRIRDRLAPHVDTEGRYRPPVGVADGRAGCAATGGS